MKLDNYFSSILICPTTNKIESSDGQVFSHGVCSICGHVNKSTITHAIRIRCKWKRPSLVEWVLGKRKQLIIGEGL